jgi:hypothetical protein
MRRRAAWGVAPLAGVLVAVLAAGCSRREAGVAVEPGATPRPGEPIRIALHFPGADGMLHVEQRQIVPPPGDGPRIAAIVGALLAGPRDEGLIAPFPDGVEVAGAFLDPHGIAYVDLGAKDLPEPPPSGSAAEMARVYSVVNSVLASEERARAVVLLWNGKQRQSFAGHLDTRRPLVANRQLVR